MEFKGTKGKWYRNTKSRIVSSVYSENSEKLIHISGRNNEESQANAQLIAHAPEMLDMLETVLYDYRNYRQNILVDEYRSRRILLLEKLIKSATEI